MRPVCKALARRPPRWRSAPAAAGLIRSTAGPRPLLKHEAVLIALNLSTRSPHCLVANSSHLEALLRALEPSRDANVIKHAAHALNNLSAGSSQCKMALVNAGALSKLNALCTNAEHTDVRATAADALCALGGVLTPTSRRAIQAVALRHGGGDASEGEKAPWSAAKRSRARPRSAAPKRSSPLADAQLAHRSARRVLGETCAP